MKLWKKVFVVVFLLFFCCFNLGIFYLLHLVYNTSMDTQKNAIISEACYLGDEIEADLNAVAKIKQLRTSNLIDCLWTYASVLRKRDIFIQYEVKNVVKYNSNSRITGTHLNWEFAQQHSNLDSTQDVIFFTCYGVDYMAVRQCYNGLLNDHTLICIYSLESFKKQWSIVWKLIPIIEVLIILFLAVSLSAVLIKLTEPLNRLSEMAKEVAAGKMGSSVEASGSDEVAILTRNFNSMIRKVEASMQDLEKASDEKQMFIEELEHASQNKQRFIDNLGHELRTPLTSISGYAEYLKMAQVSEEDRLCALSYITSESHRLQKLSNTLLDLALLREDEIEMKRFQTAELLELMQIGFRMSFQKRNLTLSTDTQIEEMLGNFELLCSLLVNLIENASRACMEGGKVTVQIRKEKTDVKITVQDDGIGIQKKDIDKIVEPFYRVDKARSRDMGGVGLGVTLCQQIVQAHHGTMEIQSESGQGTCVAILLSQNSC